MVEKQNRMKLDAFDIESVKNGSIFSSRIVHVMGMKKKDYTFKELYQLLKSQKGQQDETSLKNALLKVVMCDACSKQGGMESLIDKSISETSSIIGKAECEYVQEIARCIRNHFIKGKYVLSELGGHLIKAIIFDNSNQFLGFTQALPSEVLSYDEYTEIKKEWLKLCNLIYEKTRLDQKMTSEIKDQLYKSIKISCSLIMTVFNQTQVTKPDYRPYTKMLSENFLIFLSR